MKKIVLMMVLVLGLMFAGFTGDARAELSQWLTASNVRSYNFENNSGLVIQVGGKQVDSLCQYPDHIQVLSSIPAYETALKLFLSQYALDKNVQFQVYFTPGDCTHGYGQGNVKIQGFYFE